MMSRTKRATVLALALGSAIALTGCGETDLAARVNGQVISEADAKVAAAQIRENFPEAAAQFQTSDAVAALINAPFIIAAADKNGMPYSEQQARADLTNVSDPSPATIELVRSNSALQQLQQASPAAIEEIVADLRSAKITINPRYGTFDREQVQVVPVTPNWIDASAPSGDVEQEHSADDGHDHG